MSGRRKEREERSDKGLGVDLIPQLEEFEAFRCGRVSSVFVQLASVIHVWEGIFTKHGWQQGANVLQHKWVQIVDFYYMFAERKDPADSLIWKKFWNIQDQYFLQTVSHLLTY